MDLWAQLLKRGFGIPSPDYCLVGRWFSHMPSGTFAHANIATAQKKHHECAVGWIAHYVVGVAYALMFVVLVSGSWLARPTLLPALCFGVGSVLVPYLVMQPAYGLGIAASRTPSPMRARLKSLMAHTVFGVGLYTSAVVLSHLLPIRT